MFNYHQNYRKAMELIGHAPLAAAPSEIGANRKHRGNRLYTVIQYCLDMTDALAELHRVLRLGGLAIIVVGRESNVRGRAFENGRALFALATGSGAFKVVRRHERVFVSRYGTRVFEEILVLSPEPRHVSADYELARAIGCALLEDAVPGAPPDVKLDIQDALDQARRIERSPVLRRS